MRDIVSDHQLVRAAVLVGAAAALTLRERRASSPGVVLVPGFLALFLAAQPLVAAAALAVAVLAALIARYLVLPDGLAAWARPVVALVAAVGLAALALLIPALRPAWPRPLAGGLIAIIPGFLAVDLLERGAKASARTVGLAGLVTGALVLLPAGLWPGLVQSTVEPAAVRLAIASSLEPLALILSIVAVAGLRHNLGLRGGVYLAPGLLALTANSLAPAVFSVGVAFLTHVLVVKVSKGRLLLAGRTVMGLHVLVAAFLGWLVILAIGALGGPVANSLGSLDALPLLVLLVPGLIAVDMSRSHPAATFVGLALCTSFVLASCQLVMELGDQRRPAAVIVRLGIAVTTALTIFAPQLVRLGRVVGSQLWLLEPDPAAELLSAVPRPPRPSSGKAVVPARVAAAMLERANRAPTALPSLFDR